MGAPNTSSLHLWKGWAHLDVNRDLMFQGSRDKTAPFFFIILTLKLSIKIKYQRYTLVTLAAAVFCYKLSRWQPSNFLNSFPSAAPTKAAELTQCLKLFVELENNTHLNLRSVRSTYRRCPGCSWRLWDHRHTQTLNIPQTHTHAHTQSVTHTRKSATLCDRLRCKLATTTGKAAGGSFSK